MKIRNCVFVGNHFCKAGSGLQQEPTQQNVNHVLDIVSGCLSESAIKLITIDCNAEGEEELCKLEALEQADLIVLDVGSGNDSILSAIMGWGYGIGKNIVVFVACGKNDGMKSLPFVQEKNIIEYDGRDLKSLLSANQRFKDQIQTLQDGPDLSISLRSMDAKLNEILIKMNRLGESRNGTEIGMAGGNDFDALFKEFGSLPAAFNYALKMGAVDFGEYLMPKIERTLTREKFIDLVVEQMAVMGSEDAGKILEQVLKEEIDTLLLSAKAKVEAIGCYVTYCNRRSMEFDRLNFVAGVIPKVITAIDDDSSLKDDEKKKQKAQLHNQVQRLLYGVAATLEYQGREKEAAECYEKAVKMIDDAIALDDKEPAYHYNRAGNLKSLGRIDEAIDSIDRCLALHGSRPDYDHVRLAYQLYSMRYREQHNEQDEKQRESYARQMKQLNAKKAVTDVEEI